MLSQCGGVNVKGTSFSYNDIAWFSNAIASGDGSGEQMLQGVAQNPQSIANFITKFTSMFAHNEASTAEQEVAAEDKAVSQTEQRIKDSGYKLKISLSEFDNEALSQQEIVDKATKALEERNKIIEKEQQEVDKIIQTIQEKQKALEEASKDPAKATAILGEIKELSGELAGHLATIDALKAEIAELSEISANAFDKMEDINNEANAEVEAVTNEVQEEINEEISTAANVTTTSATGTANEATGAALATAAAAAETNIFTASAGVELEQAAADQTAAGATRISGALSNFNMLKQGIGGLTSNTQLLSSFANSIGMRDRKFSNLIGNFNNIIEPTITSLGSFDALGTETADLDRAVETDLQTIDGKDINENVRRQEMSASYEDPSEMILFKNDKSESSDNSDVEFDFETPKVKLTLNGVASK